MSSTLLVLRRSWNRVGLLVVGFGSGVLMSSVFFDKGAREPNKISGAPPTSRNRR